jgi:hypothetical protein
VDNLQEFLATQRRGTVNRCSWGERLGLMAAALGLLYSGGKAAVLRRPGLIAGVARKGASALSAWWRKPGRLARIEEHLAGLAPPRPAARPVDWCCAACGLHRQLSAPDACRCGCAAVVPAGAYGTKGNHVGGNHSC